MVTTCFCATRGLSDMLWLLCRAACCGRCLFAGMKALLGSGMLLAGVLKPCRMRGMEQVR